MTPPTTLSPVEVDLGDGLAYRRRSRAGVEGQFSGPDCSPATAGPTAAAVKPARAASEEMVPKRIATRSRRPRSVGSSGAAVPRVGRSRRGRRLHGSGRITPTEVLAMNSEQAPRAHSLSWRPRAQRSLGGAGGYHLPPPDGFSMIYLHDGGVAEPYRRQGIGRRLVEALMDAGRRAGASKVFRTTGEANMPAGRL